MKKLTAVILTIITLLTVASACADLYPAVGVVFDIDYENNLVIFEDYEQNLWAIEGIEDWEIGDIGALLMDDMDTKSIYDDEIVLVRYAGFMPQH